MDGIRLEIVYFSKPRSGFPQISLSRTILYQYRPCKSALQMQNPYRYGGVGSEQGPVVPAICKFQLGQPPARRVAQSVAGLQMLRQCPNWDNRRNRKVPECPSTLSVYRWLGGLTGQCLKSPERTKVIFFEYLEGFIFTSMRIILCLSSVSKPRGLYSILSD